MNSERQRKFKLTLFKCFLASSPSKSIRSRASTNPSAVIKSTLRTGIDAAMKRSKSPILVDNCEITGRVFQLNLNSINIHQQKKAKDRTCEDDLKKQDKKQKLTRHM